MVQSRKMLHWQEECHLCPPAVNKTHSIHHVYRQHRVFTCVVCVFTQTKSSAGLGAPPELPPNVRMLSKHFMTWQVALFCISKLNRIILLCNSVRGTLLRSSYLLLQEHTVYWGWCSFEYNWHIMYECLFTPHSLCSMIHHEHHIACWTWWWLCGLIILLDFDLGHWLGFTWAASKSEYT